MKHLMFILLLAGCVTAQTGKTEFRYQGPALAVPTHYGVASPTPTPPLRNIDGLLGDIPPNTPETLRLYVKSFEKIAFEREFGQAPDRWVRKTNGPIKFVFENFGLEHKRVWQDVAGVLKKLTGIEMVLVPNIAVKELIIPGTSLPVSIPMEPAAFVIRGYDGKGGSLCAGFFFDGPQNVLKNGVIYRGTVLIGQGDFSIRECLLEEMAQLMGLLNDSDIVAESRFRNQTKDKAPWLTWHDAIMLRTLYDERLKPGMHQAEAMPIVWNIIEELLEELNRPI
ncbi:MAG: DUF2927 domain-containing protein [Chloroflexi bacterium]|nr:DUF2927 domain-containing protein [Chloroflexota bacterium]